MFNYVDYNTLTDSLEAYRVKNQGRTLTRSEAITDLIEIGFNRNAASKIVAQCLHKSKRCLVKNYDYRLPDAPISKETVKSLCKLANDPNIRYSDTEREEAEREQFIRKLIADGYTVERPKKQYSATLTGQVLSGDITEQLKGGYVVFLKEK